MMLPAIAVIESIADKGYFLVFICFVFLKQIIRKLNSIFNYHKVEKKTKQKMDYQLYNRFNTEAIIQDIVIRSNSRASFTEI